MLFKTIWMQKRMSLFGTRSSRLIYKLIYSNNSSKPNKGARHRLTCFEIPILWIPHFIGKRPPRAVVINVPWAALSRGVETGRLEKSDPMGPPLTYAPVIDAVGRRNRGQLKISDFYGQRLLPTAFNRRWYNDRFFFRREFSKSDHGKSLSNNTRYAQAALTNNKRGKLVLGVLYGKLAQTVLQTCHPFIF